MAFVSKLYPWTEWQLTLHIPQEKPAKRWYLHQELTIERQSLRKVKQFPQGYGYLHLRHPKEAPRQKGHSSLLIRYLFHRFAIILFNESSIRRWQIDHSDRLRLAAELVETTPMTYEVLLEIDELSRSMNVHDSIICGTFLSTAMARAPSDVADKAFAFFYKRDRQRAAE